AYVVGRSGIAVDAAELRRLLKEQLPDYMVPSAFVVLESLPLTPNGKVDVRALPAPDRASAGTDGSEEPPRDELESRLAQMWADVLSVSSVGVTHDFFDLGGHSLMAVRLFAAIEEVFKKRLPLATLFQARTVRQLAEVLRNDGMARPPETAILIKSG